MNFVSKINNLSLKIISCIFENNIGVYGGALYIKGYHGLVKSCIFMKNTAIYGGGLYYEGTGKEIFFNFIKIF